jgi:hypothetical protein
MPLDPGSITAVMTSSLIGASIAGIGSAQLATGIANGLSLYASSGLTVISIDTGVLGAGTGVGVGIILPTPVLIGAFTGTFPAGGIAGIMAPALISALSIGFTQAFATAIINTVNPTVGVGAGIVTPVPKSVVSVPAFIAGFASAGMIGISAIPLATAIAQGLDIGLVSGKGVIAIAGSPSIYPSAGSGLGKLS